MSEGDKKEKEAVAERALREIGIAEGQTILDFGCGSGHYTFSAAMIAGDEGTVYALDKNERKLVDLEERLRERKMSNIEIVKSSGGANIELKDNIIDVTLLYDVFWYFSLEDSRLLRLLEEVHRVSVASSILSVYPKHIDSRKLKEKIIEYGFEFRDRYSGKLLHEGQTEKGELLNFRMNAG